MRLVLANFNNVLGLNGSLNFPEGKPLLIYGANIAGKSNIINMLRYCLIPKARERKGYAEEKRLKKNELLLRKNATGSVEICFEQNERLYKLCYFFSRKSKNVSQAHNLFEAAPIELPSTDGERIEALRRLEWKDLGAVSTGSLKEKLVDVGVYPEVLDILFSPSNVRNFSEAINGSVVRVPEVIATTISNIHDNAGKYLGNLDKLHGVITLERDDQERRMGGLKEQFGRASEKLPGIHPDEIFRAGETVKNLEGLQVSLAKELESIPSKVGEMREILALLSSEKYQIWVGAIEKLLAILPRKEELKGTIGRRDSLEDTHQILNEWKVVFEQLPPDSSPEGLLTFTSPDHEGFDFNILSNPDRIRSIFSTIDEAKDSFRKASEVCKKYKISPETLEINKTIRSYADLLKALRNPLEPEGDPALLSKREEKIVVSIPLDVAAVKLEYLRGIEPVPLIHRPERLGVDKFKKEVSRFQDQISATLAELRKAREELSNARELLTKAKRLRGDLASETELSRKNAESAGREFERLTMEVTNAYHHLCEVFKMAPQKIDLSAPNTVDASFALIHKTYEEARKIFGEDLVHQFEAYPDILAKYEVSGEQGLADIIRKMEGELAGRIEEMSKFQQEYKNVNEWILASMNQVRSIENRIKSTAIVADALLIARAILSRIYERTNVERIVEELAERIENNVESVYGMIFPEDQSFHFEHSGKGQFLSTISNEPVTHPSGSQRAAISAGIMLTLAETFGLPMILDEAFDRIDVNRLKFFCECVSALARAPRGSQICLAGYTSFNIEKNPDVLSFIKDWKTYLVERAEVLEKNIKPLEGFPSGE